MRTKYRNQLHGLLTPKVIISWCTAIVVIIFAIVYLVFDFIPPAIEAYDIISYRGDTVAYMQDVKVTDNRDEAPALTCDASEVNLNAVGEYPLTFTATDNAGNSTDRTIKVTVIEKEKVTKEEAEKMAADILDGILNDKMTVREKLYAIHNYVSSYRYSASYYGEKDDYLENAFYFHKYMQGNCRGFQSMAKVLYEAAGFEVIPVNNVDGAEAHGWNLVSPDGGQTWYHCDAVNKEVFMYTDAEMSHFNDRADKMYYDYDYLLYPATPETGYEG